MASTESSHSAPPISMKPWSRPWVTSTTNMAEIPAVISQKAPLPSANDQGLESVMRGHTYTAPASAHTTNVPKIVMCEWPTTKSVKCVGRWRTRNASIEPWKQPTRYMSEPVTRNLAGRFRPSSRQWEPTVPKKFWMTVHTGMISIIDDTMAIVWAQSAIGA